MKKYTSIEIEKITNGWIVDINFEVENQGKENDYGSEKIFCEIAEQVIEKTKEFVEKLEV